MSLLKVARMGHPVLRLRADTVSPEDLASPATQRLIDDIADSMREYDGVGLAAPQVHVSKRIVVYACHDEGPDRVPLTILVNPQVAALRGGLKEDWEGCLSVPGLRGCVPRHVAVRVKAFDRNGGALDFVARGFHARIVQHEVDHLDGILYLDRMRGLQTLSFFDEFVRFASRDRHIAPA